MALNGEGGSNGNCSKVISLCISSGALCWLLGGQGVVRRPKKLEIKSSKFLLNCDYLLLLFCVQDSIRKGTVLFVDGRTPAPDIARKSPSFIGFSSVHSISTG